MNRLIGIILTVVLLFGIVGLGQAEEVRTGWLPKNGYRNADRGELPLGAVWKCNCPVGGTISVTTQTLSDENGTSQLDPMHYGVDSGGSLVFLADDSIPCNYTSVSGFWCPETKNAPCGVGGFVYVIARDFGPDGGTGGGGYQIRVTARDKNGNDVTTVGGGPTRSFGGPRLNPTVPPWVDAAGLETGPLAENVGVPEWWTFPPISPAGSPSANSGRLGAAGVQTKTRPQNP